MVELLNTRVMCVAMAMAALTTGCAVGAAGDDESDADEAVAVEESSQALSGTAGEPRSCGAGTGGFANPGWGWGVPGYGNGGFANPGFANPGFANPGWGWGNPGWGTYGNPGWNNFGNFRPWGWNRWGNGWRRPWANPGFGGFLPPAGGGCGRI
ncbi:hypothetical protein [Sorangium sp. So ce1000]|uniref:hypothetical protein n=1 Tax=Sorangium sp. So ce1000 TaxID=3133325 RepID=UPI003F641E1B